MDCSLRFKPHPNPLPGVAFCDCYCSPPHSECQQLLPLPHGSCITSWALFPGQCLKALIRFPRMHICIAGWSNWLVISFTPHPSNTFGIVPWESLVLKAWLWRIMVRCYSSKTIVLLLLGDGNICCCPCFVHCEPFSRSQKSESNKDKVAVFMFWAELRNHLLFSLYEGLFECMCFFYFSQELYESLEKQRPKLFRLASETEENETDAISKSIFWSI